MVSFLNQYEIFFNKAKADLAAANILYARLNEGNSELDTEVICFHLQQSAEKLIKAVLSKNGIHFPKVHDLDTLLSITSDNSIELNINHEMLTDLNDYAVEGRYAVMHDDLENIQNIFIELEGLMVRTYHIISVK